MSHRQNCRALPRPAHRLERPRPASLLALAASACCLALLFHGPALAQYYAASEPGYSLESVMPGEELALAPADPQFRSLSAAAAAEGLQLYGAFRVESGMSRFFGINTFGLSETGQASPVEEQLLSPVKALRLAPLSDEPSYSFDGQQVCIGLGQALDSDPDTFEWSPLFVLSFALDSQSGAAELLARHELGAQYSEGIYALDLVRDGVVELVVPWATGVAGGGGVDVIAVVPTGGLAGFGGPDGEPGAEGSSFYSSSGAINLLDYNGDGDWELETSFPLFAAVFAYYYPSLYSFDRQGWSFVDAQSIMPEYYDEANSFYRQLLAQLEQALKRPEEFYNERDPWTEGPGYSTSIDGEELTLSPFLDPGDDPAHPIPNDYNIEALRALVAEFPPAISHDASAL